MAKVVKRIVKPNAQPDSRTKANPGQSGKPLSPVVQRRPKGGKPKSK